MRTRSPSRNPGYQAIVHGLIIGLFAGAAFFFSDVAWARSEFPSRATLNIQEFASPPDSARPWVYWFWSNGNITDEGITADLESMKRAGIGGVIIMDVVERFAPPQGTAVYMGVEWKARFSHALKEAARLGIEVRMTNGPGWCGSSGPWITPELSMQRLVSSKARITGPERFSGVLALPDFLPPLPNKDVMTNGLVIPEYYRDIAVLAFPDVSDGDVPMAGVQNLTGKMKPDGSLDWKVPPGKWVVLRIGHATTGSSTRPPVLGGNGLECDKLNSAAVDAHFAGQMAPLLRLAGSLAGKTLTSTHVDSWEVGAQNWTDRLREEFLKRRGYDPIPFLPCITSAVQEKVNGKTVTRHTIDIGGKEMAGRFRWDFFQTISELLAENYTGHLADLSHRSGISLSLEGYNLPFADEALYASGADEPMTEFWTPSKWGSRETWNKAREMASVAHLHGRPIVGAEAFTSDDNELWSQHPATIKWLGDYEFSQGVNRFAFHRFAHQPWLDRAPGATMGPWGLHYERTNTWWEFSRPWHDYLARCQWMLRQGLYVGDLLYLRPQIPNQSYFNPVPAPPEGFRYDECGAEALISRVSVKGGRLVLPDGMSYAALILPENTAMTPLLVRKIRDLVAGGATVLGPRPTISPSLSDQPAADAEVKRIADEVWGPPDSGRTTEHVFGKGRAISGIPIDDLMSQLGIAPDFTSSAPGLNWIHRREGDAEIYFVANPTGDEKKYTCTFRVAGLAPELWDPETGSVRDLPDFSSSGDGRTAVPLSFSPSQSYFVVFRKKALLPPSLASNFLSYRTIGEITGPWEVSFPILQGGNKTIVCEHLGSWADSDHDEVKYYSGTAVYRKTFVLDRKRPDEKPIFLDLGEVKVMADVEVNGLPCGIAWKPPFRVEITGAVRDGINDLRIKVVNLWPNRMIGDAGLPEEKRSAFSTWLPFAPGMPLLRSGLLGPITVQTSAVPITE